MLSILAALILAHAWAQNVTASFDSTLIGENPAAAGTREFGVIAPSVSATHTKHIVDYSPTPNSSSQSDVERNIDVQRYEVVLAGKGERLVPELYASQNQGTVTISSADGSDKTDTKISMFNYQANLALKATNKFFLGVTLFRPEMSYNTNFNQILDANNTITEDRKMKMSVEGLGVGSTFTMGQHLSIGLFGQAISESVSGEARYNNGPTSRLYGTLRHQKYGAGFAYQEGTSRGGGYRIEISHGRFIEDKGPSNGQVEEPKNSMSDSRTQLAWEITRFGFTGGVQVARTYGRYTNYRYFMDAVVEDVLSSYNPVDSLSGFIGFKAKGGSSFGGFVSYHKGKEMVSFVGNDSLAEVTRYGAGISFTYAF